MTGALQKGAIFAGRYCVVRCIAVGGMGAVYEAVHLGTGRHRALKVMHAHLFESDELRERFTREAQITSQIESEYIVDVSDAGIDEETGTPFMVMELLRGEELGDRLKRLGRLPATEVVTYLHQASMALERTHRASIVHRDLKPRNMFVTERDDGSPRLKILDFGIAKVLAEVATKSGATQSLGTPCYMAPEQFTGTELTPAADIYALAMIAYALLVGEPYWGKEMRTLEHVLAFAMVAAKGPVEPASRRAEARGVLLPAGFDAWFSKATAVNPADRFAKALDAVRTLAEVVGVALDLAPPSGRWSGIIAVTADPNEAPASGRALTSRLNQTATPVGTTLSAARPQGSRHTRIALALLAALGAIGVASFLTRQWHHAWPALATAEPAQPAPAALTPASVTLPMIMPTDAPSPGASVSSASPPHVGRSPATTATSGSPAVAPAPRAAPAAGAARPRTARQPAAPESPSVPLRQMLSRD